MDDECAIRDRLEEYLSKQGFEVYTADGGVAMRQVVSARKVDVVLLDIRMPGEAETSLARYLREHAQVGMIMVTAAGEAVDRIVRPEMGADDYVTKPLNPRATHPHRLLTRDQLLEMAYQRDWEPFDRSIAICKNPLPMYSSALCLPLVMSLARQPGGSWPRPARRI